MNSTLLFVCVIATLIYANEANCIQDCVKTSSNGRPLNKLIFCEQSCIGQDTSSENKQVTTKMELFLDVEAAPSDMELRDVVDMIIVLGLEAIPTANFVARTIVTEGAHTFPVYHAEAIIECFNPPVADIKTFKALVAKVLEAGASLAPQLSVSNIIVV